MRLRVSQVSSHHSLQFRWQQKCHKNERWRAIPPAFNAGMEVDDVSPDARLPNGGDGPDSAGQDWLVPDLYELGTGSTNYPTTRRPRNGQFLHVRSCHLAICVV